MNIDSSLVRTVVRSKTASKRCALDIRAGDDRSHCTGLGYARSTRTVMLVVDQE